GPRLGPPPSRPHRRREGGSLHGLHTARHPRNRGADEVADQRLRRRLRGLSETLPRHQGDEAAMTARFFGQQKPIVYKGGRAGTGLAYRWYDPNRKVMGKRMEDQLRFAVCYWHSFTWPGTDPFGGETFMRSWMHAADPMEGARQKTGGAFEMFRLLGVPFFTFHDRDIAPEGATLAESNRNVRKIG